jgi:hypothetical protein
MGISIIPGIAMPEVKLKIEASRKTSKNTSIRYPDAPLYVFSFVMMEVVYISDIKMIS